jgi:XTP/dITP diphosphohydrolase
MHCVRCGRSSGEADTLRERRPSVYFVTGNRSKYLEAAHVASTLGVVLRHLRMEKWEIQSKSLSEIASCSAERAAESTGRKVVTEDAGFFVEELDGFPGPYSSFVFDTLGIDGIQSLLRNVRNREASFQAAVAFCAPGKAPICFKGTTRGTVSARPKGRHGFGFDPIFVPREGDGRTFGEMRTKEKNSYSHRAKAFSKFCKWFSSSQQ